MDKSTDIKNFGKYVTGIDDIKQSWSIILNTVKGSDPLRPDFGCGIHDYLDKPINSSTSDMVLQVITDLEKYEPRATINSVTITPSNGALTVKIAGTYSSTTESVALVAVLSLVTPVSASTSAYDVSYNENSYS